MTDVIVRYDGNWRDEMDIQGFVVMTDAEWKEHLRIVKERYANSHFEIYIGTNEYIEFDGYADYKDSIETKKLSETESEVLRKLFKSTLTYWDRNKNNQTKLKVASCGILPLFLPEEWDYEDDLGDDEIEESA